MPKTSFYVIKLETTSQLIFENLKKLLHNNLLDQD